MPVQTQAEIERAELETVLASEIFARSPNLAKMLRYIAMKYLEGHGDAIKEYNVGVEALGRPPDFDPKEDSVVRVEAHRLRKKLKRYYESEGRDHPVVISLHVGHYILQFHHQSEAGTPSAGQALSADFLGPQENGGPQNGSSVAPQMAIATRAGSTATANAAGLGKPLILSRVSATRWRLALVLLAVAIVASVLAAIRAVRVKVRHEQAAAVPLKLSKASVPALVVASAGSVVRIIAGYSKKDYVDRSGDGWGPDRYYTGGQAIAQPRVFIARAPDPTMFETARKGEFSYNIPLKLGDYELRLYFVETEYGPGTPHGGGESSRVFSINLNGKPLLTGFDI